MLSYEKCIELRDNGLPQPGYAAGQTWYVKHGANEDELGLVFPAILVPEGGSASLFVAVDIRNYGHRLPINPFSLVSMAYCPTVEDMLSLLRFGYILTRTAEGNWCIFDLNARTILYWEKTPLEVLYEAWIDRRYLFEDNGRQD